MNPVTTHIRSCPAGVSRLFILGILLAASVCVVSQDKQAVNANAGKDEDDIKRLISMYAKAADEADPALASRIWCDSSDDSLINPVGRWQGVEQIMGFYRHEMTAAPVNRAHDRTAMNSANCCIVPPDSDLRRLSANTAMCPFRIDKLRKNAAEILLLGRHGEQHALGAHVPVESLDIGNSEAHRSIRFRFIHRHAPETRPLPAFGCFLYRCRHV